MALKIIANTFALVVFIFVLFNYDTNFRMPKSELLINGEKIKVEVALEPEHKMKGLSDRKSLGKDNGMLFLYSDYDKHSFWMKDMLFDLDFIWIKDNIIVDITKNVKADSGIFNIYQPKQDVNKVLEVNAGTAEKNGWQVGDEIIFDS